jgi:hypothetical protein
MAEIRPDGWTYIKPAADSGYLTTIPIALDAVRSRKLFVNSDVPKGGEIRVEILPPRGDSSLLGYSQNDCHPVTGDAIRSHVSWRSDDALPGTAGQVRLRFFLTGTDTRLFSFWFE